MYNNLCNCVGTKNVWKQLLKITQGRVRDRGVTWFPELLDKSKLCVDYWAMKNCEGSADCLRKLIDNIPAHYQANILYILIIHVNYSSFMSIFSETIHIVTVAHLATCHTILPARFSCLTPVSLPCNLHLLQCRRI